MTVVSCTWFLTHPRKGCKHKRYVRTDTGRCNICDALCRRHSAGGAGLCLPAVPARQRLCRRRHAAIAAQTLGGCVPGGHRLEPPVVYAHPLPLRGGRHRAVRPGGRTARQHHLLPAVRRHHVHHAPGPAATVVARSRGLRTDRHVKRMERGHP